VCGDHELRIHDRVRTVAVLAVDRPQLISACRHVGGIAYVLDEDGSHVRASAAKLGQGADGPVLPEPSRRPGYRATSGTRDCADEVILRAYSRTTARYTW